MSATSTAGGLAAAAPFPWASIERTTRQEAREARAMRAWGSQLVREGEVARALAEITGARVQILGRRVRAAARPAFEAGGVAVLLGEASEGAADLAGGALVYAEGALAAALVGRAVGREAPRVTADARAPAELAGALGAVLAAAARRVYPRAAAPVLRVLRAGAADAILRELASAAGELIEATFTVLLDDDAFAASVVAPRARAEAAASPPWSREALARMGAAPIALRLVATASTAAAADVGALKRGEVWLPGSWPLQKGPSGRLFGPVLLAAPTGELGVRANLGEDGRLVVGDGDGASPPSPGRDRHQMEALSWAPEGANVETENDALVAAVGEVPVVVRVEIGTVEMPAREWAALGKGDVVALGKRIGEGVVLRVGGVAIARGELVSIDGEVGVRITGRAEGE